VFYTFSRFAILCRSKEFSALNLCTQQTITLLRRDYNGMHACYMLNRLSVCLSVCRVCATVSNWAGFRQEEWRQLIPCLKELRISLQVYKNSPKNSFMNPLERYRKLSTCQFVSFSWHHVHMNVLWTKCDFCSMLTDGDKNLCSNAYIGPHANLSIIEDQSRHDQQQHAGIAIAAQCK